MQKLRKRIICCYLIQVAKVSGDADVNCKDHRGVTPYQEVALLDPYWAKPVMELLAECGANVEMKDI